MLQRYIAKQTPDIRALLKSTLYCGSQVVSGGVGWNKSVYVLRNNQSAKFFGTATCKNSWGCPVCSAKLMAKYAAEIACAIDALKEWHNQTAIMITFTIPHTRNMTCEETTQILYNTWKKFMVRGNHNLRTKWNNRDPFASFCEHFNCTHRVRVGEYTWGVHGWHPHFHCLFWIDTNKLDEVAAWQYELQQRWLTIAKRETVRQWNAQFPQKKLDNQIRADIMFSKLNDVSKAVYISVDKNGRAIAQQSSNYISGWAADRELTGNVRKTATNPDHMTPYQILQKAYESKNDKWLDLYVEMMIATRKYRHVRINFSTQSGIKAIIAKWKNTQIYIETLKKKGMEKAANVGQWTVVASFSESQWREISYADLSFGFVKTRILELALKIDARSQIAKYLNEFDIRYDGDAVVSSKWKNLIENIFAA